MRAAFLDNVRVFCSNLSLKSYLFNYIRTKNNIQYMFCKKIRKKKTAYAVLMNEQVNNQ